jgi:hypothetical protein
MLKTIVTISNVKYKIEIKKSLRIAVEALGGDLRYIFENKDEFLVVQILPFELFAKIVGLATIKFVPFQVIALQVVNIVQFKDAQLIPSVLYIIGVKPEPPANHIIPFQAIALQINMFRFEELPGYQ